MSRFHRTEFDLLPEQAFRPRAGRRGPMTMEGGGKGNSAPAPDPRLVQAQIDSMGVQNSAIKSIADSNAALIPLQKEQLQFGLDSAKTAYQQAQDDRTWSLGRRSALSGVQDQLISDATGFNTEAKREQLAGQALSDVNTAYAGVRGQSARDLARMGVRPGSGASMARDTQLQIAQAGAAAAAANKARSDARTEGYALTDRAVNALAGYPASASSLTGAGAGYAASGVGLTGQAMGSINGGYSSAANIAGQMGTNATSMFGAQANYQANMQQQSNLGGIGSILGGAASLYTSFGKSDRRLKTSIKRVGQDPRGFGIYEFEYAYGEPGRFRGVMADEVQRVDPEAVIRYPDGFFRVNYGRLGLRMESVDRTSIKGN